MGRPAATIGVLGGFGVLVLAGGLALPSHWLLVSAHSACVAICSRIAGLSKHAQAAALVVALTLCVTLSAVLLSARRTRPALPGNAAA